MKLADARQHYALISRAEFHKKKIEELKWEYVGRKSLTRLDKGSTALM